MTEVNNQLEQWVAGNPMHNKAKGECCPDFSCCNGSPIAPKPVRERFQKAVQDGDDKTKMEMLGMFLGEAFASAKKKVYVAGLEIPTVEQ